MTDRPIHIAQVSDLHLDPDRPADRQRFERVRDALAGRDVDIIVNSGDISDDGLHRPAMFGALRDWLGELGKPVFSVPGNHDVGNKAGEHDPPVTEAFVANWLAPMGDDRFVHDIGRWRVIGFDTMLLGSGFERETEQFAWLDERLAEWAGKPVALFGHMPMFLREPDEHVTGGSAYWVPPEPARDAVLRRIADHDVRLYASGHVHWYAAQHDGPTSYVWSPALQGLIVDDHLYPRGGETSGFILHTLTDDGVEHELVQLDLPTKTIKLNYPDA